MEIYRELASDFINKRREHPLILFEKEISTKSKNDLFVMSYLRRHGGMAHPKELSEEFMISTAQMAVILNQLEERQLVVRLHDLKSNRQTIVKLTEQGEAFFEGINDETIDFIARLFQKIGEEDARSLIRIMRRLTDVIIEENASRGPVLKMEHCERKTHMNNPRTPNRKAVQEGGNA